MRKIDKEMFEIFERRGNWGYVVIRNIITDITETIHGFRWNESIAWKDNDGYWAMEII